MADKAGELVLKNAVPGVSLLFQNRHRFVTRRL
jgi:hypothetical protein